jgi:putative ABC transport system permease protein
VSGGSGDCVRKPDGIIVDEFEAEKLEYPSIGDLREIGGHRARIVGTSRGIVGFLVAPYVFTTIDRANRFLNKPPDTCSYYLVEVAPGADAAEVCARVRRRVPELDAHLAGDYGRMSIDFWMKRTGLGISFGAATFLGLLVGLIMVGQTLYASVLDRLEEFATLKAIGADERQIYGILFTQAVILAGAGSVLGLLIVTAIQHGFDSPKAPVLIPWWLSLGSCITVLAICLVSSVLPYLRIRKVDPATVLQS